MFRKLTDDEMVAIRRHQLRNGKISLFEPPCYADFVRQGNFTIAVVKANGGLYVGAVKRAAGIDYPKPIYARWESLLRAVENEPIALEQGIEYKPIQNRYVSPPFEFDRTGDQSC